MRTRNLIINLYSAFASMRSIILIQQSGRSFGKQIIRNQQLHTRTRHSGSSGAAAFVFDINNSHKCTVTGPKSPFRSFPPPSNNQQSSIHLFSSSSSPDSIKKVSKFSAEDYRIPHSTQDTFTDLPVGQRVVAFGDVHGDIKALRQFLTTAKLLDASSPTSDPKWTGGSTIAVQCGDVLDRGAEELACWRLLSSLSRQAKEAGGELILLYGNHEALNSAGLFQYADPGGNQEFEDGVGVPVDGMMGSDRWRIQFAGNQPSRWAACEPGGLLADVLLANMKVSVVVGRSCFVHAGLTKEHLKDFGGVEGMNQSARNWMMQVHHKENNSDGTYQTVQEVINSAQKRSKETSISMPPCLGGGIGSPSPVWMRDYSQPNDKAPKNTNAQSMIDEALREVGHDVERMIMGHTPQMKINAALNGKAWRIDVGASKGVMGGTPEVLEIIHGGEEKDDIISILTKDGSKICSSQRQVVDNILF